MNKKPAVLPLEGKAIRFGPSRKRPADWLWRIWTEGNEIYALTRNSQGTAKISVHESGQIHARFGPKQKQDLAPLAQLGQGSWFHAFELRFLLSEGTNLPPDETKSLKNKPAYLIEVPEGFVLYTNLIVGARGTPMDCPLPIEFGGGQPLWRTQLSDGRPAILVARTLPLDSQNRERIKYIRETLKPTATFEKVPTKAYVEIHDIHWSQGGNVLAIIPMGNEAIRSEEAAAGPDLEPRKFRYRSSASSIDISAPGPDRQKIAALEFDEVDKQIELVKDQPSTHAVGTLKIQLEPKNLIAGGRFMAPPCKLVCVPDIGEGGSPRNWGYIVIAHFDGSALSLELQKVSSSIRNKNLTRAVSGLHDREEIVIVIPWQPTKLIATIDAPSASMEVVGRFTLRDIQ